MPSRPDLTGLPAEVVAYIEALEAQLEGADASARAEPVFEPSEPPTTSNVITISSAGVAKRTPRHLYSRQRRGGMGVFDLDAPENDPPAHLLVVDESATLLLVSTHGRAFRVPVRELPESPVRSRGKSLLSGLPMRPDERLGFAIADQGGAYLCIVSERGQVRRIGSQAVRSLSPGTVIHDPKDGGRAVAACWSSGGDELIIATGQGRAIRFAERLVPVRGCLGLRTEPNDPVRSVAAAPASGGVVLLGDDGKGALRLLESFAANKAPGSGGKAIMKTEALVAALAVGDEHDLFLLSKLGKIIRFRAAEIPPKEGAVQGVNCMALRADLCVAVAACAAPSAPDAEEMA